MPKDFSRTSRVNAVLKKELSLILQKEIRDPRIGLLTILDVVVTKDLQIAKVYFSILEDEPEQVAYATKVLSDAAGYLRGLLAKKVKLRMTPKLIFVFDDTLKKGNRIYKLLEDNYQSSSSSDSDQVS